MPEIIRTSFAQYDRDFATTGIIAPGGNGLYVPGGALAPTANRAFLAKFVPSRSMTIALIAFNVSTASGSDDACDVGIYDAAMNRLVSAGATTGKLNSTGVKTVAITPTTLAPRTVYYAAWSAGTPGGTSVQVTVATLAAAGIADLYGATAGLRAQIFMDTAHPLPVTVTPNAAATSSVPILALRES
jgi:hypothetical protein